MPRIIGLTGGIASGKSSVSAIWASAGATIIDADKVAREVVEPGQPAHWLIRRYFGDDVLNPDGTINRPALGSIIFSDRRHRVALNLRTHPFIIFNMLRRLFVAVFLRWESVIVLDTPLLFESGTLLPICSRTVVVACDEEQQVKRMTLRDSAKGVTEDVARQRLRSQMPLTEKAARADVVIDNSGDIDNLRAAALDTLEDLKPSHSGEVVFRSLVCAVFGRIAFRVIMKQLS